MDREHLVSTLDFTPTLLDAAGLPAIPDIDGRSFLPAMKGAKMSGWDRVFTFYNATSGNLWVPMRCIRTKDRSYIWNAWSDGQTQYRAENMAGLTWKAMLAAAQSDPALKARTDFYLYRVPEEFYDLTGDRFERQNLIHDPSRQAEIASLRQELLALLQRTGDPLAEAFAQRDKPEILAAAKQKLREEYERPPKGKGKARKAAAKAARSPARACGLKSTTRGSEMNPATPRIKAPLLTNPESPSRFGRALLVALAIAVLPAVVPAATVAEKPAAKKPNVLFIAIDDLRWVGYLGNKQVTGESIRELLKTPDSLWDKPAITTWLYNNHAVRNEDWRYIRYANGDEELYHHATDPLEWTNLANKPEYAEQKAGLAKWLPTVNNETPGGQLENPDKKAKRAKKESGSTPMKSSSVRKTAVAASAAMLFASVTLSRRRRGDPTRDPIPAVTGRRGIELPRLEIAGVAQ